ncbi:hypothetical protein [Thalassospira sp.]|uniref:hypothetical protein n=1 Tax=Thalassospira sp. TaxID=1912094 RepID=UPI0025D49F99|nr:hypothetical protein [Thalassospira sp.]|tara:strand:+ start:4347 stop:4646 length:300 start_codon:yes stop_codon:yes gene_type:complete
MLSQKLSSVTAALRKQANIHDGKLQLDTHMTDILLSNLQDLAGQVGNYENTEGPILIANPCLDAIERAVARGQVVSLADRRTAANLQRDLPPDDGGSVA